MLTGVNITPADLELNKHIRNTDGGLLHIVNGADLEGANHSSGSQKQGIRGTALKQALGYLIQILKFCEKELIKIRSTKGCNPGPWKVDCCVQ